MTAKENPTRLDPRRAEQVALAGGALQIICIVVAAILAGVTDSWALGAITFQIGIGILFWAITYCHLRLRRGAREEALELAAAERRRHEQGLQSLFAEAEKGQAAVNLAHLEKYIAPAVTMLLAVVLLLPGILWLVADAGPLAGLLEARDLVLNHALAAAALSILMSLACFLLGTYAAGLAREKPWSLLRAGAGYMMSSALFLFLAAIALALAKRGWVWLDLALDAVVCFWMALQAVEMLVSCVLDLYRPRLPGVEPRPGYDSRLSGLLAEPQGLLRTFAHTLDYQFGFKVSETWFFRFLERAFLPLLLIQLLSFYLLTCFVVVRPGERAIIERWGAPRGVTDLPENDAEWDRLAPPLEPGLHLKWPWPIEVARVYDFERVTTLLLGEEAGEEEAHPHGELVLWDKAHAGGEERHYLVPLPPQMTVGDTGPQPSAEAAGKKEPDALLLSGEFAVEYRISKKRPGDIYRYAYVHQDPERILRALFEREITSYLAGAEFWNVLLGGGSQRPARQVILERLRRIVAQKRLGLEIIALNITNVHPPVGEVGKAYQEKLASQERKKTLILAAETEKVKILGETPAEVNEKLVHARAYRDSHRNLAEAKAERFRNQLKAYTAAPEVYRTRTLMRILEESLPHLRVVIKPEGVAYRLDRAKLSDLVGDELDEEIKK